MSRKQIQQTLIGVILLGALYYYFSPQQNCIRDKSDGLSKVEKLQIIEECADSTVW